MVAMPNSSKDEVKTAIEPDGLRYKSKTPGSPFAGHGAFAAGTMSCFKCGKHRPRAVLKSRRILNRNEMVCTPSCQAVSDLLAAGQRVGHTPAASNGAEVASRDPLHAAEVASSPEASPKLEGPPASP
jgi:hypothetical protein